jgi:hypothetical protein
MQRRSVQRRSAIGVFWIAILLMASLVPFVPIAICVVGLALSVFAVDVPVKTLPRAAEVRDDQPLSLLSVHLFRGPPSLGSLV